MIYTPNYQLPQYEENDVTSYMVTYNQTMGLIDTAMHDINTEVVKNTTDVSSLENQMTTANDEINSLTAEVSDNTTAINGHGSRLDAIDQKQAATDVSITQINTELDSVADVAGTVYRGVLSTNEETIAISIGNFNDNTLVDVYTSVYGVNPKTIELREASSGQPNLCVMTFDAQSTDINVAVVIRGGETNGTV